MSEWQDIASREWQDGDEALIANDRGVFVGAFDETWTKGGHWMISDGKDFERPLRGSSPTHWQPLPPPPESRR